MSNLNRHPVRRAAVGVLAGTLAFTGGAIAAGVSPANAVEGFAFERLAGSDRYETAAEIAMDTFPDGATTAIIARGDDFADALAANYLAGVVDAPILLTDSNDLPAATAAALAELGVEDVIIVGGTTAVSAGVQAELAGDYSVSRLGGADRYLTAELIAGAASEASAGAVGELGGLRTAIVASGQVFADALAAGPIAYAGNHPVVLTRPGDLPSSTADVLADLDIEQVVIVGGPVAVSADVEADAEEIVGADAIRIGGQTRYETAAMIAEVAYESFGFDDTHVNLARGDVFADALAGGPHAGEDMAPILLTASDSLSPATEAFLEEYSDTLQDGHIFGGLAAVSQAVEDAAEEAAQGDGPIALTAATVAQGGELTGTITGDFSSVTVSGCGLTDQAIGEDDDTAMAGRQFTLTAPLTQATGECTLTFTATPTGGGAAVTQTIRVMVTAATSNQTLTVTPDTDVVLPLADESAAADVADDDNRTYVASGLTAGTTYRVTLVNDENITVTNGVVSFVASADDASSTRFSADTGTDIADIISVNNIGQAANTNTQTTQPVNGSITFTVDGVAPGTVTPVLYVNGGTGGTATTGGTSVRLEVNATAAGQSAVPSESFGVGGSITYTNPMAGNQVLGSTPVQRVDKGANIFDANNVRFSYDANDTFSVGGIPATLEQFEAALSSGDTIAATYSATAAASSSFQLTDTNPVAPTAVTATAGTGANSNDIVVGVTFPAGTDTDAVVIQRAAVTSGTVGSFTTIATSSPTAAQIAAGTFTYTDENVAPGTYRYQVALSNDGDQSAFVANAANAVSVAPGPDQTQPTATDTRLVTDAGFAGLLDAGDVFVVRFNEPMAAPAAGATIRVRDDEDNDGDDSDDTIADLVNGTNATFTLNAAAIPATPTTNPNAGAPAGTVLTVTLTGAPVVVAAGAVPGVDIPARIINTLGINDAAGNRLNLSGSSDLEIDAETTVVAQNLVSAVAAAGTQTMTVTYQNPVTCASVAIADFTFTVTGGTTITPTSFECTGTTDATLVFTFPGSAFTTQAGTVAVAAGAVNDANGQAQAADTVNFTTS